MEAGWYLDWLERKGFPSDSKDVWRCWNEFFAEEYCKKEILEDGDDGRQAEIV
jgi:hypothetical protein